MKELPELPNKELSEFSDDALSKELTRREAVRKVSERAKRLDRYAKLTQEIVDVLEAEHSRTSCSDASVTNGFTSPDHPPRCARCALLEILANGPEIAEDWEMNGGIHFVYKG